VFQRGGCVGLFGKSSDGARGFVERGARDDVPVPGFRTRWNYPNRNQAVVRPGRGEGEIGGAPEGGGVAHRPVGVKRQHFGLGVAPLRFPRRPDQGRRGGGCQWLDQDIRGREVQRFP
jgi:hypothetical protein